MTKPMTPAQEIAAKILLDKRLANLKRKMLSPKPK